MSKSTDEFLVGILTILVTILFIGLLYLVSAYITMLCWNCVSPSVFHGPSIDFPQAFAITILLGVVKACFGSSSKSYD